MEKIGQLFIVGIDGDSVTEQTKEFILKYKIGGFILYRKNFKSYADMLNLIRALNDLNKDNKIPLFIAIDQEGGRVNRMPSEFKNLPSASTIVRSGSLENVRESAQIIGKMLIESGINMNFAPVLDIKRFDDNHAIGNRCYGETKEEVMENGILAMKEMKKQGLITVIKHFPGHGATRIDSHFTLPIIIKRIKKLEQEDISVFKNAIENGADAMMVGHLMVLNVDLIFPASLSKKFITGYLREKMSYNGIIITDNLKMKSTCFLYGKVNSVIRALKAGNDLLLTSFENKYIFKALEKIKRLVQNCKIDEDRINESVDRVISLKKKYIKSNNEIIGTDIDNINQMISKY